MSKRSRHADNSKRQQPVQQQRAQARQLDRAGPASGGEANRPQSQEQPGQVKPRQ